MPAEIKDRQRISGLLSGNPDMTEYVAAVNRRLDNFLDTDGQPDRTGRAFRFNAAGPGGVSGYVLVWHGPEPTDPTDPKSYWHFVDLTDMPDIGAEINNPPFFSPDFKTFQRIVDATKSPVEKVVDVFTGAAQDQWALVVKYLPWIVAALVAVYLFKGLHGNAA